MELLDNTLPETLLGLVVAHFRRNEEQEKAFQTKLIRTIADKHRLHRLRASLSGTFRERFMDVALSDTQFAQMACIIAEFQQYLLHDDILALCLYCEEAALEILANAELCAQLTAQELTNVLFHHPHTTSVLLEIANQHQITINKPHLVL